MSRTRPWQIVALALAVLSSVAWQDASAQKYGGVLRALGRGNPPSLSPHEESTIETVWISSPYFNNLLIIRHDAPQERIEDLLPELAESWSWQNGNRDLVFKLKPDVSFHDGKPFTARDVKATYDAFRGASDYKPKLNPRIAWWHNVVDVATTGDRIVTFRLGRPQPSLLSMLASGFAPVYPAHIDFRNQRAKPVGTGPFLLKAFDPDKQVHSTRNPDYFVRGRPYLDGIQYTVIRERATRQAALQAHQVDISFPGDTAKGAMESLRKAIPGVLETEQPSAGPDEAMVNTERPPFDNPRLQRVLNLALDRNAFIRTLHQGAGLPSASLIPPPFGVWGLPAAELAGLPGYGDPQKNKDEARQIMRELGYGPDNPVKVVMTTRLQSSYVDVANWVIAQLKQVWIEATLEQLESAQWFARASRKDYTLGVNNTGSGPDPDMLFFENFRCGSPRNYTGYCNREMEKVFERASSEVEPARRMQLTHQAEIAVANAAIRPALGFRLVYEPRWPEVKGFYPKETYYYPHRMQELWLDR